MEENMTRQEIKLEKLKKEQEFINSIKKQKIDGKIKNKFRLTSVWKTFREFMQNKYKVDYLTHRKLKKGWQLHHKNLNPKVYTELNEESFTCLNAQQHDVFHTIYSEYVKDPTYLDRLNDLIKEHYKLNDGKDVKDFIKD